MHVMKLFLGTLTSFCSHISLSLSLSLGDGNVTLTDTIISKINSPRFTACQYWTVIGSSERSKRVIGSLSTGGPSAPSGAADRIRLTFLRPEPGNRHVWLSRFDLKVYEWWVCRRSLQRDKYLQINSNWVLVFTRQLDNFVFSAFLNLYSWDG